MITISSLRNRNEENQINILGGNQLVEMYLKTSDLS